MTYGTITTLTFYGDTHVIYSNTALHSSLRMSVLVLATCTVCVPTCPLCQLRGYRYVDLSGSAVVCVVCVCVDDGSASSSTRDSSSSPTPSSGTTSLGHDEEGGMAVAAAAVADDVGKASEKQCHDLLALVDELKWYHEQCSSTA